MSDYARKIKGLLAKAEGTTNEHERDAYQSQAERLMVKWGIDDAMLAEHDATMSDTIGVGTMRMDVYPIHGWGLLMTHLGAGLGTVRVFMSPYGKLDMLLVHIVGFKRDVDRYRMLCDSVCVQAQSAMVAYWAHYLEHLPMHESITRTTKESQLVQFLSSYGNAVGDRLRKERLSVQEEVVGADLVVIGRDKEIDDFVNENTTAEEVSVPVFPDYSAQIAGWTGGSMANLYGRTEVSDG